MQAPSLLLLLLACSSNNIKKLEIVHVYMGTLIYS